MPPSPDSAAEFARLSQSGEGELDLGLAALVLARQRYPDLDVGSYLARLDAMADAVRDRLGGADGGMQAVKALTRQLSEVEGFRGNERQYYDPRNSYLNEVMDLRLGIPITLSLVYMEVGRRVPLAVHGVGLPGHFLVRVATEEGDVLLDPFHGGKEVTEEDCQERLDRVYGGLVRLDRSMLLPVTKRQILVRVLNNLKIIYLGRGEYEHAMDAVESILTLEPSSLPDLRDRGLLRYRQNRFDEALSDLRKYLLLAHDAEDRQQVRQTVQSIETIQSMIR